MLGLPTPELIPCPKTQEDVSVCINGLVGGQNHDGILHLYLNQRPPEYIKYSVGNTSIPIKFNFEAGANYEAPRNSNWILITVSIYNIVPG